MNPQSRGILEQRLPLKGLQRFVIASDGTLECTFQQFSKLNQFRIPLSILDANTVRAKSKPWGWVIATLGCLAIGGMMTFASLARAAEKTVDQIGLLVVGGFFFVLAGACLKKFWDLSVDALVFVSRYNGQSVFSLWHERPDKQSFDSFVDGLKHEIKKLATLETPAPEPNSLVDEIAKLKKLLDAGALSPEEFEKAKLKLLEPSDERRIGFTPYN